MKSTRLVAIFLLVAVCAAGWMLFFDGISSNSAQLQQLAAEAQAHQEAGRYQLAINAYQQVIAMDDDQKYFNAYIQTCEAFYADEKSGDAQKQLLAAYDAYTDTYSDDVTVWEKYVQVYLDGKNYRNAVKILSKAENEDVSSETLTNQWYESYFAYKYMYQSFLFISSSASFDTYVVKNDSGWGTIETTGEEIFNTVYHYVGPLGSEGHVLVVTANQEVRILDAEGVVYGRFQADVTEARGYSEGLVAVKITGQDDWCFLNQNGQEVFGGFLNAGMFQDGQAAVQMKDGNWYLINKDGNPVSDAVYEDVLLAENGAYVFEKDFSVFKISGKWKLFSDNGSENKDFSCDAMDGCYGKAMAYCQDGKWGFVNTKGRVIIEPAYEAARSFSGGVAAVCRNGLWGFVDEKGTLVIDFVFEDVGYFDAESGTCPVKLPGDDNYQLISWVVSR